MRVGSAAPAPQVPEDMEWWLSPRPTLHGPGTVTPAGPGPGPGSEGSCLAAPGSPPCLLLRGTPRILLRICQAGT